MSEEIPNTYRVNKSQWKKWPDDSKIAFNELYSFMIDNQDLFQHPMAATQVDEYWKTTCHNAAWWSADIAQKANKQRVKDDKSDNAR